MASWAGLPRTASGCPCSTTLPPARIDDARRVSGDEIIVVRGDEERAAAAGEGAQDPSQLAPARRIERRGRLVQQQNRRIEGKGAGDRDALRLAAGQLARPRPRRDRERRALPSGTGRASSRPSASCAARARAPAARCRSRSGARTDSVTGRPFPPSSAVVRAKGARRPGRRRRRGESRRRRMVPVRRRTSGPLTCPRRTGPSTRRCRRDRRRDRGRSGPCARRAERRDRGLRASASWRRRPPAALEPRARWPSGSDMAR